MAIVWFTELDKQMPCKLGKHLSAQVSDPRGWQFHRCYAQTEAFILGIHSQATQHSRVHPPSILSGGSLQETPLKNSHFEVILQQPWEFRRVQLCESMQAPSSQGCNLLEKRREFIAYTHFPLLGWAGMRQQQVKNCSAKDVLLNKTLTCHKHDLALEFVISRNFRAGKDFSSREQDLPQQRWQKKKSLGHSLPWHWGSARGGRNWCSISLWCGRVTFEFLP